MAVTVVAAAAECETKANVVASDSHSHYYYCCCCASPHRVRSPRAASAETIEERGHSATWTGEGDQTDTVEVAAAVYAAA